MRILIRLVYKRAFIFYTSFMKIFVQVKANAREEAVERLDEINFRVSVKELPERGRANEAVIAALAEYFKVPPGAVRIVAGHTSKKKIIEIL